MDAYAFNFNLNIAQCHIRDATLSLYKNFDISTHQTQYHDKIPNHCIDILPYQYVSQIPTLCVMCRCTCALPVCVCVCVCVALCACVRV